MANVSISYRRRKFKNWSATRYLHDPRTLLPAGKLFKGFLSFIVVVHITVFKLYRRLIFCWMSHRFPGLLGSFLTFTHKSCYGWLISKRRQLQFATGTWSQRSSPVRVWFRSSFGKNHCFSTWSTPPFAENVFIKNFCSIPATGFLFLIITE